MTDTEIAKHMKRGAQVPWLAIVVAGGIVVLGAIWYRYVQSDWNNADTWGSIGDAVGPFTGLATALALGFAVYATMLQREELRLQRDEMRAQRAEMAAQRAEAAKAAAAQEDLAASQARLAAAQEEANRIARQHVRALRLNTISTAYGALILLPDKSEDDWPSAIATPHEQALMQLIYSERAALDAEVKAP